MSRSIMTLNEIYLDKCNTKSDINEHLPILKEYGEKVDHITEMGVRDIVSTYALLMAKPKRMVSYDIIYVDTIHIHELAPDTTYDFIVADTTKIVIEPTDLLFIDTLHSYDQLKKELELHANKTSQFIILHDTEKFGTNGERGGVGLMPALNEFLQTNKEWITHLTLDNNNGLTILKRTK